MSRYHDILGVSENATPKEIKAAYRRLAKQCHPDLNPDDPDAEEKFIRITEAHNMLLDPQKQRKSQSYQRRTVTEEDLRDAARERAKAYARMRYAEFQKRCREYEATPMHKLFWPKWVNFIFLALSVLLIVDNYLPKEKSFCTITTKNEYRYHACGHSFLKSEQFRESEIRNEKAIITYTPILGFVHTYFLVDQPFYGELKPSRRETDYIFIPILLFVLTVIVLVNKVKKLENKLLFKAVMMVSVVAYGLMVLGAFL